MKRDEFEKEINLLDMFWAVCQKWRSIILVTVLVTVAVGIYSYFHVNQAANQSAEAEIELTDEEKVELSQYAVFEKNYENQKEYVIDSPFMSLDANGYNEGILQYWIKTEGESVDGMRDAILYAYKAALKTEDFYEKIEACLGDQYEKSYYGEIIDTENLMGDVKQVSESPYKEKGIIAVQVRLMDKESVEKILDIARQELATVSASISGRFGNHELILIADNIYFSSSEVLATYQRGNLVEVRDNYSMLTAAEKELSDTQLQYLENSEEAETAANAEEEPVVNVYVYVIKQMLIACIGLVVVMVLLYALMYLFNGRLRVEDSIEHMYGVTTLAKIQKKDEKKWNFIDRLILNARHANIELVDEKKSASMLASSIRIACKKEEKAKVLFTSHGQTQEEKKLVDLVKKELSKDGIEVRFGGSLHKDCKSLEDGFETSMVILMENAGETKYKTIEKEVQLCNSYGMTVVGMVIIS